MRLNSRLRRGRLLAPSHLRMVHEVKVSLHTAQAFHNPFELGQILNPYTFHYKRSFAFYRILYLLSRRLPSRGLYPDIPGAYGAYYVGVAIRAFRGRITPNGGGSRKGNPRCNFLSTCWKIRQCLNPKP